MNGLLRPTEVANMLGVSRTWLYDAAKAGRIPSVRLGGPDGPLRFIEQDLDEWLERARQAWRPATAACELYGARCRANGEPVPPSMAVTRRPRWQPPSRWRPSAGRSARDVRSSAQ